MPLCTQMDCAIQRGVDAMRGMQGDSHISSHHATPVACLATPNVHRERETVCHKLDIVAHLHISTAALSLKARLYDDTTPLPSPTSPYRVSLTSPPRLRLQRARACSKSACASAWCSFSCTPARTMHAKHAVMGAHSARYMWEHQDGHVWDQPHVWRHVNGGISASYRGGFG